MALHCCALQCTILQLNTFRHKRSRPLFGMIELKHFLLFLLHSSLIGIIGPFWVHRLGDFSGSSLSILTQLRAKSSNLGPPERCPMIPTLSNFQSYLENCSCDQKITFTPMNSRAPNKYLDI